MIEVFLTVNARFLSQKMTGVQRFASEIAVGLKHFLPGKVEFLCPKNIYNHELANELEAKPIGVSGGHLWEQIDLPLYLASKENPLLLNLANTAPIFYPNKIVTVYDLTFYHHPEWFSKLFSSFYKFTVPINLRHSRHIFTDSYYVKKDIINCFGINDEKISVLYGAPARHFRELNLPREDFVLAVGSLEPRKNLRTLMKVFSRLKRKRLLVVGEKNRVFSEFLTSIKIPENVEFTGRVSDETLVELYNRAGLFVYPSLSEGFGIPPLEAQACGCPVLVSNVTSLPEACGDSAIFCDPENVEDTMKKIEMILDNPKMQSDLRQKGFKNIQRFSWQRSALDLINVLEKFAL